MTTSIWQARIDDDLGQRLDADKEVLGLQTRTEMVKAGLELLARQAAELRMARDVDEFYRGEEPPLPVGVQRSARRPPRG